MSWRYPKGHTRPDEVVAIDGLNDGFLPVVEECQGKLNEQNFKSGAITATPIAGSTDSYVPSTFVDTDVWEWVKTTGPFPPAGDDDDESPTRGSVLTPGFEGINNQLEAINGGTNYKNMSVEGWVGSWAPANAGVWSVIGADSIDTDTYAVITQSPMVYETILDESTTAWIMCSLQAVSLDYKAQGIMFGIFVNGALIAESVWGSGDLSNTPTGTMIHGTAGSGAGPSASIFCAQGAGSFTPFMGFPACVEAILEVPPGPLTIEIKCIVQGLPLKNVIGSRELVILFLGR